MVNSAAFGREMRKLSRISVIAVVGVLGVACATDGVARPPAAPDPQGPGVSACKEPRPHICSPVSNPVCALRDTREPCRLAPCDSAEWKTYTNACTACSDPRVMGYRLGRCAD